MNCVYRLWSRSTGHYYLGSTNDVRKREATWRRLISRGGSTKRWKSLLSKVSLRNQDNWRFDVIYEFDNREDAAIKETAILKTLIGLPLCLNSRCSNPDDGSMTTEARLKIRDSRIGQSLSDETKKKVSASLSGENSYWHGKTHSDESKVKMRAAKVGKPSPRKGVKLSDETKEKLRNRKFSTETREKMRESAKLRHARNRKAVKAAQD